MGPRIFAPSPVQVPYFRCPHCGFIFTDFCDRWSAQDFAAHIYNADYVKADPPPPPPPGQQADFSGVGAWLADILRGNENRIRLLDFGAGGNPGRVGRTLIDRGFDVSSYEPFFADRPTAIQGPFDFIFAIEVLEHCVDPLDSVRLIAQNLKEDGLLFLSTVLHPQNPPADILGSWYIAPRNGHISIHTLLSLSLLFAKVGINIVQHAFGILGFRKLPPYPTGFFV